MQINSIRIIDFAKGASKKCIKALNDVGLYTKTIASMIAQRADEFISTKTNVDIAKTAEKAEISKNTLLGAGVSFVAIVLAYKAIKGIKNKIIDLLIKK